MKEKTKFDVATITLNALIAATYVVLTYASTPIAYGAIQFRIAEILMLFPFFNKRYAIGVTLGCLLANLLSPFMVLDVIFGTLATLIACVGVMFCKHLLVASFIPVVCNAFIVSVVLTTIGEPYWMSVLTVGLGELAVMTVAYIIFMILRRNKNLFLRLRFNQNLDFKF